MTKDSKIKLVVVGQTPPPFNGQAKMIEVMLRGLTIRYDVRFVRMEFSDSVSTAGKFGFGKIVHLIALIIRTWKALGIRRNRYLYYPPASPNLVPVVRDVLFLLAVRPWCKGLVLQFHAGGVSLYAAQHPFIGRLLQLAYGRMTLGIVQGESCPDDPSYFKAINKVVIPYGIDLKVHSAPQRVGRRFRILYVGIHTADKGLFVLLETAKLLLQCGVDFELHTVGKWYTQTEEKQFLQGVEESGLKNRVLCVGQKTGDDLWQEYAWADVLFFPTHYPWETMGIVQLEAMAYGLPVVASDWQGPKDVVIEGETGFLCSADDPSAFADRLQQLAKDPALCGRMGATGRARYESMYTVEQYMHRLNKALQLLAK
jgi:glycosyltransferase involved in cell wall biosynthesis